MYDVGTCAYGSGLMTCLSFIEERSFANLSAPLLLLCPTCADIQISFIKFVLPNLYKASFAPATQVLSVKMWMVLLLDGVNLN